MTERREKFLEGLKYRLEEKTPKEQEAEIELANFVECAQEFADQLEHNKINVNATNLYEMFVQKKYSGRYDIFKLDKDEGMLRLAIDVAIRERNQGR